MTSKIQYQIISPSESDSTKSASLPSSTFRRVQFSALISLQVQMNLRQRSFISRYSCEARTFSFVSCCSSTSSVVSRQILPFRTSTRLFIDLNFSSAESLACRSSSHSRSKSFSLFVRLDFSSVLSFSSSSAMYFSRKDWTFLVFSSQLIFSRNSTCFMRYYFSLSSFLFYMASFSLTFSSSWISLIMVRFSPSDFRLRSRSSSSCSRRRSHSPSLTRCCVSSISMRRVSAFSSRTRSRLVLVRVYMVLRDLWSLSRSSMREVLNRSTKLQASSWIWLTRKDCSWGGLMQCELKESSRDRLESTDLSRSDRLRVKRFGLSSSNSVTFLAVFSADKINFQLIYKLLFSPVILPQAPLHIRHYRASHSCKECQLVAYPWDGQQCNCQNCAENKSVW